MIKDINFVPGDKVKLAPGLKVGYAYEGYKYTENMHQLKGKELTIRECFLRGYFLEEDNKNLYTNAMLKLWKQKNLKKVTS